MENPRQSLSRYPVADPSPTVFPAPAEGIYTLLGLAVLPVAVLAKFGVWFAGDLLDGLAGKVGLVAQAVEGCNCCKTDRAKNGKETRPLIRLPLEITQDKIFKRKGLPIRMCRHCDGEAYEEAMRHHIERTG